MSDCRPFESPLDGREEYPVGGGPRVVRPALAVRTEERRGTEGRSRASPARHFADLWSDVGLVNPDSELYRAHPDWVQLQSGRKRTEFRNRLVLNRAGENVRER